MKSSIKQITEETGISRELIVKAASLRDSKMSWSEIAETLSTPKFPVDAQVIRKACEMAAGKALADYCEGVRTVNGVRIVKKLPPKSLSGTRWNAAREIAENMLEGDCAQGIKSAGIVQSIRTHLKRRGLCGLARKNPAAKSWDMYAANADPAKRRFAE